MQWTADGLHHDPQSGARMVVVFIIVVVVAALVYLLTKSPFSAGAIAVIGLLFGIIGSKRPQALDYRIDTTGIMIGQKRYSYSQFRSFAIIDEGGYTSIALMPLKRFLPMLSVFYDPQIQSEVVEALSAHLPLEDHKRDLIDQLTSIIKL